MRKPKKQIVELETPLYDFVFLNENPYAKSKKTNRRAESVMCTIFRNENLIRNIEKEIIAFEVLLLISGRPSGGPRTAGSRKS